jgi:hypothetical protein
MVTGKHLISRLVQIEMYNLKNICPFVYKITDDKYTVPLRGYCLKIDNKIVSDSNNSNHFISLANFYATTDNKIIHNDEVDKPLNLSKVYFINGYNSYVPILSHIQTKYNITCDVVCQDQCNDISNNPCIKYITSTEQKTGDTTSDTGC